MKRGDFLENRLFIVDCSTEILFKARRGLGAVGAISTEGGTAAEPSGEFIFG